MLCVESHVYSCTCCLVLPILCVLGCRWWPSSHITTAVAVVGRAGVSGAGSHKPQERSPEKELRAERTNNAPPRDVARVRAFCAFVCVRTGWWSSSPAIIGWLVCEPGTFRGLVQP